MRKHPTSNIQSRRDGTQKQHPTSKAHWLRLLLALTMMVAVSPGSFAQSSNAPSRLSYDSFRTISDRNIFNPNRYARSSGRAPRTTSQPASRVESISLVGVMAYEKGWFAFFDGTRSNYKQAVQQDGTIGNYTVAQIAPDAVKLAAGTNTYDLKVGMQMRREDEGDWFLSAGGQTTSRRAISMRTKTRGGSRSEGSTEDQTGDMLNGEPEIIVIPSDATTEITEGETPVPNGNGNESNNGEAAPVEPEADNSGVTDPVLLRLMQRRQQMNQ